MPTARLPGLLEQFEAGSVICAEGYLFECERRGYLQASAFGPLVVPEHPEVVTQIRWGFVDAGPQVASRYAEDMSQHAYLGTGPATRPRNRDYAARL